ncbi:MAG: acyl-CoA synthetase [Cycloclasticus sp.]|nr:MAG: acyl-CoA synthetase [Cycloclasticus sp.]
MQGELQKTQANYVPLSPISFLTRAAKIYPARLAISYGTRHITYDEFNDRVRRFASALKTFNIGVGDTVSIIAPNVPALLEAHYAVPALGAVLSAINTRLDAPSVAFILEHSEAKVLLVDDEFADLATKALQLSKAKPQIIRIADKATAPAPQLGVVEYEDFLAKGDPHFDLCLPNDEWQPITLNYTSGTTGNAKGAVYSHRGAYLNAVANTISFGMTADTVYLWTLPMFHCNGWSHTWAVTLVGGTHVCLRKVEPKMVFDQIENSGVTHICAAPIVLNMLIHAPAAVKKRPANIIKIATGGAPPPSTVIVGMEDMGFEVVHLYGLTETYGPATICEKQDDWVNSSKEQIAQRLARQGQSHPLVEDYQVGNIDSSKSIVSDGKTVGEIQIQSNTVMMGYHKNPKATKAAFEGGWFHTGDLAVMHPDAVLEIKDRAKDVIISGGENISSIEIEEVLTRNPKIREAAVVAKPDEKWGETPCAFVELVEGAVCEAQEAIEWCRQNMAGFKVPKHVVFGELPKTSTGKIKKFVLRERTHDIDL